MTHFDPETIQIMRTALDDVMTRVPPEHATVSVKVYLAEVILKAAAHGQTTYDGLLAAATEQIKTIVSMLT